MARVRFRDRAEAGRQLADELRSYGKDHPVVLAIPNGGVPVGFEVARALGCQLDFWVVKRLGVPWHSAVAVGAIAEGGQLSISRALIEDIHLSGVELAEVTQSMRREVGERVRKYRGELPRPELRLRTVLIIDDGATSGATALAAIDAVRAEGARQIVLAVPVASPGVLSELGQHVDRVVCLNTPTELWGIGLWYDELPPVSDEQAMRLLDQARQSFTAAARARPAASPLGPSAPATPRSP